jgi:hypothetical protein
MIEYLSTNHKTLNSNTIPQKKKINKILFLYENKKQYFLPTGAMREESEISR